MAEIRNNRIAWLDSIRVVAMLMVVFMHTPIPNKTNPLLSNYLLGALSYLTSPCIGLFFMASGALILPVRMPLKDFLKKRFSRILFPTLLWSIFYIAVKYFYKEADLIDAGKLILQIPFGAVEGVLWFMYTLTGLYLFAPVISKWLEVAPKREIQYFLVLWLVVMTFPYFKAFVIKIRETDYHLLSTFSGFMGYMVLGYYLKRFPIDLSICTNKIYIGGGIFVISVILPALFYFIPIKGFDPRTILYNYLSISVVMMCAGWFVFIQNMGGLHSNTKVARVMKEFSEMSFGIYLSHIFVMRRLIWSCIPVGAMKLWIEIIVVSLSTLIISYLIVKIISRLPFKQFIIG